jgi:hypothetical protein
MIIESLRFFDNDILAKTVNLTEKEIDLFRQFEYIVLSDNGLRQINGGYSKVTICYIEEDENILICEVECGEQDCGEGKSSCWKWQVNYNRKTQKFEET